MSWTTASPMTGGLRGPVSLAREGFDRIQK
jgi:hypothetical protein